MEGGGGIWCTQAISANNLRPGTPNLVPLCSSFSFRSPSSPPIHLVRIDKKKSTIREQYSIYLFRQNPVFTSLHLRSPEAIQNEQEISYLLQDTMCPVLHVEGLRTLPGICVVGLQRAGSSLCVHSAFHMWWWCLLSFFTAYHSLFRYITVLNFITLYHQLLLFQSHFSVLYHLWHASLSS